jgi:hypothetical protein
VIVVYYSGCRDNLYKPNSDFTYIILYKALSSQKHGGQHTKDNRMYQPTYNKADLVRQQQITFTYSVPATHVLVCDTSEGRSFAKPKLEIFVVRSLLRRLDPLPGWSRSEEMRVVRPRQELRTVGTPWKRMANRGGGGGGEEVLG